MRLCLLTTVAAQEQKVTRVNETDQLFWNLNELDENIALTKKKHSETFCLQIAQQPIKPLYEYLQYNLKILSENRH